MRYDEAIDKTQQVPQEKTRLVMRQGSIESESQQRRKFIKIEVPDTLPFHFQNVDVERSDAAIFGRATYDNAMINAILKSL